MNKRQRTFPLADNLSGKITYRDSYAGPIKVHKASVTPSPIIGTQITVSEGHPFHSRKRGKLTDDVGGEFFTTKNYLGLATTDVDFWTSEYPGFYPWARFQGPVVSYPANASWPPPFPPENSSSKSKLESLGATAIARCAPTNSVADVSTFLGELLKDGLPSIPGQQAKADADKFRSLGSEYLNVVFGWQPFINDIRKFAKAVAHADRVLAQYERDAGRVVRRRYNFPVSVESETTDYGVGNARYFPNRHDLNGVAPYGSWVREREITRSTWFSGAFTYYLPSGYDSRNAMARYRLMAEKVFGISLTPEVLWNLAPWSWAADWFGNAGDVLTNVSNRIQDGLILRYGYLMEHTITKDTYTLRQTGGKPVPLSPLVLVTETKKRVRANPYGFGVTWDGLSPSQLAILAALGLSKR